MSNIRQVAKLFIPPILYGTARRFAELFITSSRPFEGPFESWQEAVAKSDGWDAPAILEKTLAVSFKLRDGAIAFQQDTIIYNRIIYSEAILAFIAMAAAMGGGKLNVIDFGGSLGTNFFQNKRVLQTFIDCDSCLWNVIERPATAELGRNYFQNSNLRFHNSLAELRMSTTDFPKALVFSGSFQYVCDPQGLLDQAILRGVKLIAFDRLLVSPSDQHKIYVQHADPKICYAASYPVRCFSRAAFVKDMISRGFARVEDFTKMPDAKFDHCGLIFVRSA